MIGSLGIRCFKRFIAVKLSFAPLTVLTGLNGTGKSTALQALLLARQVAENPATRVIQPGPRPRRADSTDAGQ